MSWHSQNSVGWWSFSSIWFVSHQLFSNLLLFHTLTTYINISRSFSFYLLASCSSSQFTLKLSSLISVFLITHNNKLLVTLSWQKSLLWICENESNEKRWTIFAVTDQSESVQLSVDEWQKESENHFRIYNHLFISFHVQNVHSVC